MLKEIVKLERKYEDEKKESVRGQLQDDQKLLVSKGAGKMSSEGDWGAKTEARLTLKESLMDIEAHPARKS